MFCLVDVSTFLAREKEFPTVRRQLAFADAVFLTKTDLVESQVVEEVRNRLTSLKPGVKILDTAKKLPWYALFETESSSGTEPDPGIDIGPKRRFFQGGKHHDAEVLEFTADSPLDPDRLGEIFKNLDQGILRAKGIVHLADPSADKYKYIVQYTGAQKQLYSRPWTKSESRRTTLVFLGSEFDSAGLKAQLDACITGAIL